MKLSDQIYYQFLESTASRWEPEVLVFLHGLGMDHTSWRNLLPYLRQNYHVLLIDVRGHGNSQKGAEKITWKLLVEDVRFILNKLQITQAHLVGHTLGGYLAIQLAKEFPELVQSLVLISTACVFPESWGEVVLTYKRKLAEKGMKGFSRDIIPYICHPLTDEKELLLETAFNKASIDIYFDLFHLIAQTNWSLILQRLHCPILNLSGEWDPIYPPNVISLGVIYMSNARYLIVPGASNAIQLDQPKVVSEWIMNFIDTEKERLFYANDSFLSNYYSKVKETVSMVSEIDNTETGIAVQVNDCFRVEVNGVEVLEGWNQRNAKYLLLYLLVHGSATREQLCDAIWPEIEIGRAKGYLRVSLNHLRKLIEQPDQEQLLYVDKEHVFLGKNVKSDYHCLKKLIQECKGEEVTEKKLQLIENLQELVTLPLFPGFYQEWVNRLREEMENDLYDLFYWAMRALADQEGWKKIKLVTRFKELENIYSIAK
ncbi:alpha/beta fold hydrolase [Brevibacillus sp. SYSU BS000544]|uniref:alpha/beta fold hydrolase n=1 Tax=Brevibacillus sp. SYSU BS000544 TaxID=3416443 RepID=UPI003CE46FBF